MDPKLEKYRDSFIKEMNSRLEVLKEYVPKLKEESNGRVRSTKKAGPALPLQKDDPINIKVTIEEIYRACHSIKGTAAFMGCADIADQIRPLEKYLYQIRASVTEGKDIRDAITGVEFPPDPEGGGTTIGSPRELANLLSQSAAVLEQLVRKV